MAFFLDHHACNKLFFLFYFSTLISPWIWHIFGKMCRLAKVNCGYCKNIKSRYGKKNYTSNILLSILAPLGILLLFVSIFILIQTLKMNLSKIYQEEEGAKQILLYCCSILKILCAWLLILLFLLGQQLFVYTIAYIFHFSINKYHSDYIKCDDPNQEDQGHKWSLSALLRHLKANGIDTVQVSYNYVISRIMLRKDPLYFKITNWALSYSCLNSVDCCNIWKSSTYLITLQMYK